MTLKAALTPMLWVVLSVIILSLSGLLLSQNPHPQHAEYALAITMLVIAPLMLGLGIFVSVLKYKEAPSELLPVNTAFASSATGSINCCFVLFAFILSVILLSMASIIMQKEHAVHKTTHHHSSACIFAAVIMSLSGVIVLVSAYALAQWSRRKYNA